MGKLNYHQNCMFAECGHCLSNTLDCYWRWMHLKRSVAMAASLPIGCQHILPWLSSLYSIHVRRGFQIANSVLGDVVEWVDREREIIPFWVSYHICLAVWLKTETPAVFPGIVSEERPYLRQSFPPREETWYTVNDFGYVTSNHAFL